MEQVKRKPKRRLTTTSLSVVPSVKTLEAIAKKAGERVDPMNVYGRYNTKQMILDKKNRLRQRRRKVTLYHIQGYSMEEMAEKLGVTEETIRKDLTAMEAAGLQDIDIYKTKKVFLYYQLTVRTVINELWMVYYNSHTPASVKVSALKEIADKKKQEIEMMQDLGLLWKEPQKLQLETGELVTEMTEAEIKTAIKTEMKKLKMLAAGGTEDVITISS